MERDFLNLFAVKKPIIGMIHLKGDNDQQKFEIAKKEIEIMTTNGIDALLIENYFGRVHNVEEVLEYLSFEKANLIFGVNILGNYKYAFQLAEKYRAKFIQVDSVAGHLPSYEDELFEVDINKLRKETDAFLIGGVRFKYQPVYGVSLEEDLKKAMTRCDAIVVTGSGTGITTDLGKIKQFRDIVKAFPIIVGAGLTLNNCEQQLSLADGGIIGSYLKEDHIDTGDLSEDNVKRIMSKVKTIRH